MPLPAPLTRNPEGLLFLEGIALDEVASEFGTPVYVISAAGLRDQATRLQRLSHRFCSGGFAAYAYKANTLPNVCALLNREGLGAEVSSLMELRLALDIGVNPSHIVFNGPGKVDEALRLAIRAGVGFLNADSMSELFSINRIAAELDQPVQVGLRVGPTIARELHGRPTRFGVDLEGGLALDCLRKAAELERLRIHGIHFHLGTQIGSSTPFRQAVAETLELISRALDENLMEFRYLDIGGGFAAVPSTCRPELEAYMATQIDARVVESVLEPTAEALMGFNSPSILFEPGRLVVAQSALLLARVLAKTTHKATTGFVLDCGQTMLSSNLTLKLFHDVLPVQVRQDTSESPINLFGCLCYEADVISLALPLPPLENGDLVAVLDCGAYDMQLATPFIVSRPSVVLVEGNQALQIRYEEAVTAQSLVSLGVGPALLPLRVR